MRQELICFLESIKDETVMTFMIENFNSDGLTVLFSYLEYCDDETKNRWENTYHTVFEAVMSMKKRRIK